MMKAHKIGGDMKDDTRLALLEQSIGHINETMMRIEKRFDAIDFRFDRQEKRIDETNRSISDGFSTVQGENKAIREEIKEARSLSWSHFRWIMGAVLALFGTIVTVLIKGHLT